MYHRRHFPPITSRHIFPVERSPSPPLAQTEILARKIFDFEEIRGIGETPSAPTGNCQPQGLPITLPGSINPGMHSACIVYNLTTTEERNDQRNLDFT
jgi:hypothetical protein